MKKLASFLIVLAFIATFPLCAAALSPGDLTAESAILMDADTGQILYEKDSRGRYEPASITKVLTAMLVLEHASPGEQVLVSETATDLPPGSSHVALIPGEQFTVSDALYAMMLPSANDASNVLAEHIAGSNAAFADLMNQRAQELGATSSHFSNPHGLSDADHYTTAYDMALITRAALQNDAFRHYFGAARYDMQPTNLQSQVRHFSNYQYMLHPEMWVYNPDVIGGKVGYTDAARHTMTTAAQRDGRTLVCVVLSSGKDEKFYDTQLLLDYGFEELFPVVVPLPSEQLASQIVPVIDGKGAITGEASFSLPESEISLLLPAGTGADDVSLRYNLPETVSEGESADTSLTLLLHADEPGLPTELLNLPLDMRIRSSSPAWEASQQAEQTDSGALLWLLVIIPALLIAVATAKIIKQRRRAARRMRRRQRVLAEQRRYQQAVPSRSAGVPSRQSKTTTSM